MDEPRVVDVPEHSELGAGSLGVPLLISYRAFPWRVDGVLYRDVTGRVVAHPEWSQDRFADVDDLEILWDYLVERGGNGITTFAHGFTVRRVADITPLVLAKAAESVAAPCGPMASPIEVNIGDVP